MCSEAKSCDRVLTQNLEKKKEGKREKKEWYMAAMKATDL